MTAPASPTTSPRSTIGLDHGGPEASFRTAAHTATEMAGPPSRNDAPTVARTFRSVAMAEKLPPPCPHGPERMGRHPAGLAGPRAPCSLWSNLEGTSKLRSIDEGSIARLIEKVRLERGPCEGPCPVYDLTLRRDGTASWHGEAFTHPLADFDGTVAPDDFSRLAGSIERAGFFSWGDEYLEQVYCHPAYVLEVVCAGEAERVLQYATDEPPGFRSIAEAVDAIRETIRWTRRRDP